MKVSFRFSLDFTYTEKFILVALLVVSAYAFINLNYDSRRIAEAHRSPSHIGWHNGAFDVDGVAVTSTGQNGVFTEAGLPVNSAAQFVNWVTTRINGSNYQDRVAAAFFVNTMLDVHRGGAYTTVAGGVAHARSQLANWSARIYDYEAAGRVNWRVDMTIPTGFNNSFYQQSTGFDDAYYYSNFPEFMPVIVFYNPDGTRYMIKKNCGNPIGDVEPLGNPATNWDYDVDISPSSGACTLVSPGITFRVTSREVNNGDGGGPGHTHRIIAIAGASRTNVQNYTTIIGGTGGGFNTSGGRSWGAGGLGPGASATRYVDYRINLNAPDNIQMYFVAEVAGAAGQSTPTLTTTDPIDTSNDGEGTFYTRCIQVDRREYNYEPSAPTSYSTQARYYAGYTFDMSAPVRNIGDTTGPTYQQRFTVTPGTVTGDPFTQTFGGLASGATRTMDTRFTRRFTIPASTSHGTVGTCSNYVSPDTGLGPPSPFTGLGTSQTVTNNNCFTVENRRFNIRTLSSADVTFNPTTVLPTQPFDVDVLVCNDGPLPAGAQPGTARRIQTTISPGNGNTVGGAVSQTNDISYGGGGCITIPTSWTVSNLAQLGQQACVRVQINRDTGFSEPAPNGFAVTGSQDYVQCIDVSEQAYIEVTGSSVWAGGNFDNPGNGGSATGYGTAWCAPSGTGRIETARLNGIGAYADYVAGATGAISNFGSEHINTGTADGTGLSFANVGVNGLFGQGRCITDLTQYLSTDTARTGVQGLATGSSWPTADGQWIRTGDLTISGHTINAGDRFTIYVDGDVTITDDLVYGSYSVADKDLIPSLIIVATGDIDIQAGVENLHGVFFSRGSIDTCSNQGANLSSGVCRNHLTVVGQFIADDIQFRRTFGGVSGGNTNGGTREAEEFLFSPELYLANPILISDFTPQLRIDQLVDLPPVIN